MFSEKDLSAEVEREVEAIVNQNIGVKSDWLAHRIVGKHPEIFGNDKDFYVICAFGHAKAVIRAALRKYQPNAEGIADKKLPPLPGFEHLQAMYPIDRDGESTIIPIDELTDSEIDMKTRQYESMAEGCRLHAAELRRYKFQRGQGASA